MDPPTTPTDAARAPAAERGPAARWAGRIVFGIVAAVATVIVVGLLAITVGPRILPYQALIVRSGSMSPTIPTGSVAFYKKISAGKVKVGNIIVFTKPGSTEKVTHRVFRLGHDSTGPYFVTKGDANGTPDDWHVPAVGTGWIASFHIPVVGYVMADMQSTLGRLLLLIVPALLLGAITLYEIWHDRRRGATE